MVHSSLVEKALGMNDEALVWLGVGAVICLSFIFPFVVLCSIMWKRENAIAKQRWILKNGRPGKGLITAVHNTNARNGRDHFILEVSIKVMGSKSDQRALTIVTAVSPLDLHQIVVGAEIAIRLHPNNGKATLDLPASKL